MVLIANSREPCAAGGAVRGISKKFQPREVASSQLPGTHFRNPLKAL